MKGHLSPWLEHVELILRCDVLPVCSLLLSLLQKWPTLPSRRPLVVWVVCVSVQWAQWHCVPLAVWTCSLFFLAVLIWCGLGACVCSLGLGSWVSPACGQPKWGEWCEVLLRRQSWDFSPCLEFPSRSDTYCKWLIPETGPCFSATWQNWQLVLWTVLTFVTVFVYWMF